MARRNYREQVGDSGRSPRRERRPEPQGGDAERSADERPARFTSPPRPSPATKSRSRGKVPRELADANRGTRLQKVIAEAGVASRRHAEELIAAGRVTVNGKIVSALPAWVDPFQDRIEVNGHPIPRPKRAHPAQGKPGDSRKTPATDHVYVILHKPRRVISSASDDLGRTNVTELVDLPETIARRLFPVGRLDADSTGLIMLTNDGELTHRLTHPSFGVTKQYLVVVRGTLTDVEVARLKAGVYLAHRGGPAAASPRRDSDGAKKASMEDVQLLGHDRDPRLGERTKLLITLREGQNREIRRMMARLGLNVRRLQRVAIGPITIKGLAAGAWRMLTPIEVARLKRAAGM